MVSWPAVESLTPPLPDCSVEPSATVTPPLAEAVNAPAVEVELAVSIVRSTARSR